MVLILCLEQEQRRHGYIAVELLFQSSVTLLTSYKTPECKPDSSEIIFTVNCCAEPEGLYEL